MFKAIWYLESRRWRYGAVWLVGLARRAAGDGRGFGVLRLGRPSEPRPVALKNLYGSLLRSLFRPIIRPSPQRRTDTQTLRYLKDDSEREKCMDYIRSIRASACVSVSDLKKNPSAVMEAAGGKAVAILNHNRPVAYVVPVDEYERMLDALDDAELASIAKHRKGGPSVKVTIDELRAEVRKERSKGMAEAGLVREGSVSDHSGKAVAKSSGAKRKAA